MLISCLRYAFLYRTTILLTKVVVWATEPFMLCRITWCLIMIVLLRNCFPYVASTIICTLDLVHKLRLKHTIILLILKKSSISNAPFCISQNVSSNLAFASCLPCISSLFQHRIILVLYQIMHVANLNIITMVRLSILNSAESRFTIKELNIPRPWASCTATAYLPISTNVHSPSHRFSTVVS